MAGASVPRPASAAAWVSPLPDARIDVALLLPTEHHVEVALADRERLGASRSSVRTLRGFAADALARVSPHLRIASQESTRLAARLVLDAMSDHAIRYPDEPAARVAFADAVDHAVGSLRRSGASASHLRSVGLARARLVAEVMEGVDALFRERDLCDPRGVGAELAKQLRARDRADSAIAELVERRFVVTGLASWDAVDLEWMETLHARSIDASRAGGVVVTLPRLGDGDDDPMGPTAARLEARWASLRDPPEIEWCEPPSPRDESKSRVVEARSVEAEARAVAAAVLGALDAGTPPERIAIVVPNLDEERLDSLRGALGVSRVPFSEPQGRPVTESPEARAAIDLLAMAEGPITRDQLIGLLRAPGAHTGWWTEKAGESDAAVRATMLAHRLRDVPVKLDPSGDLFAAALAEMVASRPYEAWMPRALARVLESVASLGSARSRRDLAGSLGSLFDRIELGRPSVGELSRALRAELSGEGALSLAALGEGSTSVRAVRDALAAIVDGAAAVGLADAPCSAAEIAIELARAASSRSTVAAGARSGAVRIARASELCALRHDLVVITGLDGQAYGAADGGGSLLDDRACAALPAPVRPQAARERDAYRKAELAWVLAWARAVVLTRAASSEDDEVGEPHPLAARALSLGATFYREPASRVSRLATPIGARSAHLIAMATGAAAPAEIEVRAQIERARAAFFLEPRSAPGPHTGSAKREDEDAPLRSAFGGGSPESAIAVTAIERAAGCFFSGFASRVLRVRRGEDADEAASARDRGTLVHRAIEAAFDATREHWSSGDPPLILRVARLAAEGVVRGASSGDGAMAPLRREAVEQAVHDVVAAVAHAIEHDDGARFALAEQRFGAGQPPPWGALELALPGDDEASSGVFVEGQIDRIDRAEGGEILRVIDYKTGRVPDLKELGRTHFQLPLYAEVVSRAFGGSAVSAHYVRIRSGGAIEQHPSGHDQRLALVADRGEAIRAARAVVLRMWGGDVAPRPLRPTLCVHCDARDVCRRPAVMPSSEDDRDD